jgi:hypothetical protein
MLEKSQKHGCLQYQRWSQLAAARGVRVASSRQYRERSGGYSSPSMPTNIDAFYPKIGLDGNSRLTKDRPYNPTTSLTTATRLISSCVLFDYKSLKRNAESVALCFDGHAVNDIHAISSETKP